MKKAILVTIAIFTMVFCGAQYSLASCPPVISIPATACAGTSAELSITDLCNCIDGRYTAWDITDPLGGITHVPGSPVSYTFTMAGAYKVCVSWSDKCSGISKSECDTVYVTSCCPCDMKIDNYTSTTNYTSHFIHGSFRLRSGTKRVVGVEVSIPYFNYGPLNDSCSLDCKKLGTGLPMGNFTGADSINGQPFTFPGCLSPHFAREVDWSYATPTTIDQQVGYTITIPPSFACPIIYDYCIKVRVKYEDCTSCECTFCVHDEKYSCGCDVVYGKAMNNTNSQPGLGDVKIYPNPNGGQFTIAMGATNDAKVITLLDMGGRVVSKSVIAGELSSFELGNVAAGTYNVVITADGAVVTRKVVITR